MKIVRELVNKRIGRGIAVRITVYKGKYVGKFRFLGGEGGSLLQAVQKTTTANQYIVLGDACTLIVNWLSEATAVVVRLVFTPAYARYS